MWSRTPRFGMSRFTESVVEEAAFTWLEALGYAVAHGPEIAPGESVAERANYKEVLLEKRLRKVLEALNPGLPQEALEDALRRITRPEGPTLDNRNRGFHRQVVEGVNVE